LLETVVQYIILFLYIVIKWVDNFREEAQEKKKSVFSSQKKQDITKQRPTADCCLGKIIAAS